MSSRKIPEPKPPFTALSDSYQMAIVFPISVQHLLCLELISAGKRKIILLNHNWDSLKEGSYRFIAQFIKTKKDAFLVG